MGYTVLDHRGTNEPLFKDTLDALIDNDNWLKALMEDNFPIVHNPSFEYPVGNGLAAEDWTFTALSSNGTGSIQAGDGDLCSHGAQSYKVAAVSTYATAGGGILSQSAGVVVPFSSRMTLTVSLDVLLTGGFATASQTSDPTVNVRVKWYDVNKSLIGSCTKHPTGYLEPDIWYRPSFTFAPADFTDPDLRFISLEFELGRTAGLELDAGNFILIDGIIAR